MEEGRVRASGPAAEIAERYMNEVNLQALADQATSLQAHRGGTGEVRYVSVDTADAHGRASSLFSSGDALVVRASYVAAQPVDRPVFQIAIVDVDTGVIVTTASSAGRPMPDKVEGSGEIEIRFDRMPLRPRQYVLRLSITDAMELASYDLVVAGPRFAVTGRGAGVDSLADEQDGLVSLPYELRHRPSQVETGERV
jgi:hypothetical protein